MVNSLPTLGFCRLPRWIVTNTSRPILLAGLTFLPLLAPAPAQAGPIMQTFYGNESGDCSAYEAQCSAYYAWAEGYSFTLTFEHIYMSQLDVWINDVHLDEEAFQERLPSSLSEYDCLPIVDPVTNPTPCREFVVSANADGTELLVAPGSQTWEGYNFDIAWNYPSDFLYPDDPGDRVRVLHERGRNLDGSPDTDNIFDYDMCEVEGCEYYAFIIDPGIRSGDTDFHSFAPSYTPVPEPSSLLLLMTAAGGFVLRGGRSRKTKK